MAHKAKGREWDSIRLEDDFVQAETDEDGKPREPGGGEKMRILYVAITRAKTLLHIGEKTARFIGVRASALAGVIHKRRGVACYWVGWFIIQPSWATGSQLIAWVSVTTQTPDARLPNRAFPIGCIPDMSPIVTTANTRR